MSNTNTKFDIKVVEKALGDNALSPYKVKVNTFEDFLKIRETLTRMGWLQRSNEPGKKDTLWQLAHITEDKDGTIYICHFKHMYMAEGTEDSTTKTNLTDQDLAKLHFIVQLLQKWNLLTSVEPLGEESSTAITIVPHSNKDKFNLRKKYYKITTK